MDKRNPKPDLQEALRFARSPAGQQLLAMLQQKDAGTLETAKQLAQAGQYQKALEILSKGGSHGGSGK